MTIFSMNSTHAGSIDRCYSYIVIDVTVDQLVFMLLKDLYKIRYRNILICEVRRNASQLKAIEFL